MLGQSHYYDPQVERCAGCDSRRCYIDLIPPNTRETIDHWVMSARPVGGFVEALLTNDLMGTFKRADTSNIDAMRHIMTYLYNEVPITAYGSAVKMQLWRDAVLHRDETNRRAEAERAGA